MRIPEAVGKGTKDIKEKSYRLSATGRLILAIGASFFIRRFTPTGGMMSFTQMHLLLNHFPIIGTVIGIAMLAVALLRRSSELGKVSLGLFAGLGAIAILVFFTGEPAEAAIKKLPDFSEAIVEKHEEFALAATIVRGGFGAMAVLALAACRRRALPRWVTMTAFAVSLGAAQ